MQILTNLNPKSIVIMLCLYKEWHQLQVWIKSLFSLAHQIRILVFPFDLPLQSGTCIVIEYSYKFYNKIISFKLRMTKSS